MSWSKFFGQFKTYSFLANRDVNLRNAGVYQSRLVSTNIIRRQLMSSNSTYVKSDCDKFQEISNLVVQIKQNVLSFFF